MTKDNYIKYLQDVIKHRTACATEWGKKAGIKAHKFGAIKMPTIYTEVEQDSDYKKKKPAVDRAYIGVEYHEVVEDTSEQDFDDGHYDSEKDYDCSVCSKKGFFPFQHGIRVCVPCQDDYNDSIGEVV